MNVLDVDQTMLEQAIEGLKAEAQSSDGLDLIFTRQRQLIKGYVGIEKKNGFWKPENAPVDLHHAQAQMFLKDLSWRCVEELTESLAAVDDGSIDEHTAEELSDGLHFLTELMIYSGFTPHTLLKAMGAVSFDDLVYLAAQANFVTDATKEQLFLEVVKHLGRSMNRLKCRPWKATQILTDVDVYKQRLVMAFYAYIRLMVEMGARTPAEVLAIYIRKSEVNLFRQRSNY